MKKDYFVVLVLSIILFYLLYLNMKGNENSVVLAQGSTTTTINMCVHTTDPSCCGNHVKEPGNNEQCDYKDSDCSCFEKCDIPTCQCYDFTPQLSGCSYYDNCSSVPGEECNCHTPPGVPCFNQNCWNAPEEVCNGSSKMCNTWFIC